MSEGDDWLDLPDGKALVREALLDDTSPPTKFVKLPVGVDEEYVNTVKLLRRLRPKQRTYIRALMQAKGRNPEALKIMADAFIQVDASTISRWYRNPDFARAVDLMKKQALRLAGIDPVGLMLRAGEVIEHAMTPRHVLDREGKPTGVTEVDGNTALRGIEWLGKVHKMTQESEATRVTLEIVNLANRDDVIDVTPEKS